MLLFETLSKSKIYSYHGKEVVFIEFDPVSCEVKVRDMTGRYFTVPVWELNERGNEGESA